jgi:hypothetical protein
MKRFLLAFSILLSTLFATSQVVFNEFYTDPNSGKHEFFELYNTSLNQTPEKLNSYTLVVYYVNGNSTGFYVLDFPDLSIESKKLFVGASAKSFNVQLKTNVDAGFSWNDAAFRNNSTGGALTNWVKQNSSNDDGDGNVNYNKGIFSVDFNDLFPVITGNSAAYAMMLFKDGGYINGFLGGYNSSFVQASIKSMPDLNVSMISTNNFNFTIDWDAITLAENTTANGGSDNGFVRERDGLCGSWIKSSSGVTHTPGLSNGIATELNGKLEVANVYNCSSTSNGTSTVTVNITGATGDATAANTLPVEVQLYYDNKTAGILGALDGNDTYIESISFDVFNGPEKSFIIPAKDRGQPVLLVYKTVLGCFDRVVDLSPDCITLPVTFSNFHAQRNKSTVALKWETASEQNNRGFNVQRNAKGVWETVAFVFSAADGGNSSSLLSYSYNDINNVKGVSQYRIQQVDLDGKASYSTIRSVKGEGQANKAVVYPNPATEGKVNVVLEDQGAKAVTVSDISGRVVRQYRSVVNSLVIDGLESGLYTIQITDLSSAVSTTEKVIIKKR